MGKNVLTILVSLIMLLGTAGTLQAQPPTMGNIAYIEQVGNYNEALQTQTGQSNYAATNQDSDRNIAEIIQQGSGNNDLTAIDPTMGALPVEFQAFFVDDWKGESRWYQYQNGLKNSAEIETEGNYNGARQWQEGNKNVATIQIIGNNNAAQQVQLNGGNIAHIYINASGSSALQYQEGGKTSTITIGTDNTHVRIVGSSNWP